MDLYPVALTLYALLAIATLASLKSALGGLNRQQRREQHTRGRKIIQVNPEAQQKKKQEAESCRILKYFITNYTIVAIFRGQTGISLLSLLLSYSIVSIFLFYCRYWQVSLGFALTVSLTGIILQLLQEKSIKLQGQSKQQDKTIKIKVKSVLFVLMAIITLSFYLSLLGLCFKNYINSQLSSMLINLGIVFAFDNLASKPFVFLAISLMVGDNRLLISIIQRQQQRIHIHHARVANNFDRQPETKHHLALPLQIEPQPIDFSKPKQPSRIKTIHEDNSHGPQALPSSSIIDTIEIHPDASLQNMISRVQSRKSGLHKLTSMKELNEVELEKIEQNPNHDLQQYFCINLRRERDQEENRQLEGKMQHIIHSKDIQTSQLVPEFIIEDFICHSPKNQEPYLVIHDEAKSSSKYSKSKGSLRGNKTIRILQRQNEIDLNDKENMGEESTKHEISENDLGLPKEGSHCSHRRMDHNRTHILKISDTDKETGQLEEIDINSPNRRVHPQYDTHVIPEEKQKRRRNRRGTTKEVSQPYLLQDKLIEVYFPGRNKSDFDNFLRSKKKNFDRSQFFNHSNKKEPARSRDKPIVHEQDDHHTEFFVPKF